MLNETRKYTLTTIGNFFSSIFGYQEEKVFCRHGVLTCATTDFKISSESIPASELSFLNNFSECLLHIINFPEFDIKPSVLFQPILLLHYDTMPGTRIFPHKLLQHEKEFLTRWYFQRNLKLPEGLQKASKKSQKFLAQLFEYNFRLSSKNTFCDLFAYVHPPNQDLSFGLYHKIPWSKTPVLKEPFWMAAQELGTKEIATRPKISLLICKQGTGSTCENTFHEKKWIFTVFSAAATKYRLVEIVLIFETLTLDKRLSILCPYCNPCNPFQMVDITLRVTNFNELLINYKLLTENAYPTKINVVFVSLSTKLGRSTRLWNDVFRQQFKK